MFLFNVFPSTVHYGILVLLQWSKNPRSNAETENLNSGSDVNQHIIGLLLNRVKPLHRVMIIYRVIVRRPCFQKGKGFALRGGHVCAYG